MIHYLPNALTMLRIISVPLLVLVFQLPGAWSNWAALFIFVAAGATDYFDGLLARRLGATTNFGRILDPIADKLLAVAAIAVLLSVGNMPLVPAVTIICREILVSGLREYVANREIKIPVSPLAKWKTVAQFSALGMLLAGEAIHWSKVVSWSVSEMGAALIWIAAVLTVITGYGYWKIAYRHIVAGEDQGVCP